jgi:hypothetical protein
LDQGLSARNESFKRDDSRRKGINNLPILEKIVNLKTPKALTHLMNFKPTKFGKNDKKSMSKIRLARRSHANHLNEKLKSINIRQGVDARKKTLQTGRLRSGE